MAKDRRQAWEVHLDAPELGAKARVGTLYRPVVRTDLAASFAYDPALNWRPVHMAAYITRAGGARAGPPSI